jgi:hypothetical protein
MKVKFKSRWNEGDLEIEANDTAELIRAIKELEEKTPLSSPQLLLIESPEKAVLSTPQGFPATAAKSVTDAVMDILSTEWGETPRKRGEVISALEANGLRVNKDVVGVTLRRLWLKNKIKRSPMGGQYGFFVDKTLK